MKFRGTIIAEASGSIGGITFSHNAGGSYVRRRATPTNPDTPAQRGVRDAMALLMANWVNVLTDAQREGWKTYAKNVPMKDSLGNSINVGAVAMYTRGNVPRLNAGKTGVANAPTTFNLGSFTPPVLAAPDSSAGTVSMAFTAADEWAHEVGAHMLVYASTGQNPSINFFKGPYQLCGIVSGAATPPTSPATITLPFAVAPGQKVFFQVNVSRADGRLSNDFRDVKVAGA